METAPRPRPSPHRAAHLGQEPLGKREAAVQGDKCYSCVILGVLWVQSKRTNTVVNWVQEGFPEELMSAEF